MARKRVSKYKQRKYEPPESGSHLVTAEAVVAALGGLARTARITECKNHTSVHNWIAFNQFPAKYFLVMTDALRARGYTANRSLWDQRGNHDLVRKALSAVDAAAA
jgi:hypothetical protein